MPYQRKFAFSWEITESDNPEFPNQKMSIDVYGNVTLIGMLEAFQSYLEGAGYIINGSIRVVPDEVEDSLSSEIPRTIKTIKT